FWIPAKRLGYVLFRIKDRYRDETLELKWASAKVRKLIDKHLLSLGVDTKVREVSILSDEFKGKINELKTPKSKASEMEHAIRWHIKVNLEKDPTLYSRFKDRLETILNSYKDNWDTIVAELEELRNEMKKGRKPGVEGIPLKEAPFFDLLKVALPNEEEVTIEKAKVLSQLIMQLLTETAQIKNFWTEKRAERKRIEGLLQDEISYSGIEGLNIKAVELTTELMKLAEKRMDDLK
ncbi:MAG: DUF3387 domain-containing protein, partial [Bacteroidetes bacterium]|nr:DUF3387 domain-containing protein [Bacteroidota bacterium]